MQNFQGTFETHKQSFISAFSFCMTLFLIFDKQAFWGCFMHVMFQGISLLVIIRIIIKWQIRVYWNFICICLRLLSAVLEFVLIFDTESRLVLSELNQISFKYFNNFFTKKLLPLRFKCCRVESILLSLDVSLLLLITVSQSRVWRRKRQIIWIVVFSHFKVVNKKNSNNYKSDSEVINKVNQAQRHLSNLNSINTFVHVMAN